MNRLCRSVLFTPAWSAKMVKKSLASSNADIIILDLEDGCPPSRKEEARELIPSLLSDKNDIEKSVIRVNGLETPWGIDDVAKLCHLGVPLVVPKAETYAGLDDVSSAAPHNRLWAMIETPRGVLAAPDIASHPSVDCLVLGTSDLSKDVRYHCAAV